MCVTRPRRFEHSGGGSLTFCAHTERPESGRSENVTGVTPSRWTLTGGGRYTNSNRSVKGTDANRSRLCSDRSVLCAPLSAVVLGLLIRIQHLQILGGSKGGQNAWHCQSKDSGKKRKKIGSRDREKDLGVRVAPEKITADLRGSQIRRNKSVFI